MILRDTKDDAKFLKIYDEVITNSDDYQKSERAKRALGTQTAYILSQLILQCHAQMVDSSLVGVQSKFLLPPSKNSVMIIIDR